MKGLFRLSMLGLLGASCTRFYQGAEWELSKISTADPYFLNKFEFWEERQDALEFTRTVFPEVPSLMAFDDYASNPTLRKKREALEFHVALEEPCNIETREEAVKFGNQYANVNWPSNFHRSGIFYGDGAEAREEKWNQLTKASRTTSFSKEKDPDCKPTSLSKVYSEKLKDNIKQSKGTLKNYLNPINKDGTRASLYIAAGSALALGASFFACKKEEGIRAPETEDSPLSVQERLHQRIADFRSRRQRR